MSSTTTHRSLQTTSSKAEACCMAFTPQSCSTNGGEIVFITYSDDFPLPSEAEFFLVFEGFNEVHVTTSQQINQYTLRAVIPGHKTAERVSLTVFCLKHNTLGTLSSHKFLYYLETEHILAQLLAQHVSDPNFLESFVSLCSSVSNNISCNLRDALDSRITSAFELLDFSPSWTVFGDESKSDEMDNGGFETTLLHLSAHLGFNQFASFLMDQPGASDALNTQDKHGKLPLDIAQGKGLQILADVFLRGAGEVTNKPIIKEMSKPHVTKSELGTTTISHQKTEQENMIDKDIDMLREMNNLVKDELSKRAPIYMHSWPVNKEKTEPSTINDEHQAKKDIRSPSRIPGSNRLLLEQNLKRLRDINEEIQKLRVTSQRNNREPGTRGSADRRQKRRLSCPSFRGQDIAQAHMMIAKPVNREEKASSDRMAGMMHRKDERELLSNSVNEQTHLDVNDTSELRRRSWGDKVKDEDKIGYRDRFSSSLDDLTGPEIKKTRDPSRSRTQVINLPKHLTKQEESNKLADIIESIKYGDTPICTKNNKDASNINSVSMQGKSLSYSCLANLKLDDGVDSGQSGELNAGTEDSEESEEHTKEHDKPQQEKGIRRLSMLFGGSKSAKHGKRELLKPGHSKSGGIRSSMRKEKGQSMTNLSVKDAELKGESKDNRDSGNKTALARRASGLTQKGSKLGDAPTFPNPGMLTKMGNHGNKPVTLSHSMRSTSPLPFRRTLNPSQDEGDDKSMSGVSLEGSGDEEDEEGVFTGEGWTDSDLDMKEEPDAWNLTVEKKILKKMTAKDIKRQDVIHELLQTEVHYVRTLKIMFKIFYGGMVNTLHMTKDTVGRMFPRIEELLDMHSSFLTRLKAKEDHETIVEKVGDVLEEQFSGQLGKRMKEAYGDFCSHHIEAVDLYKKKLKNDKRFADFVKRCSVNKLCRRLSVPECITLVTQRLTKYPLLFEAIIKTTKESKQDYGALKKANALVKGVLHSVDDAIKEYEKQKTLQDIRMRMDLKISITYKGGKVKNIDFVSNTSKLHYDGVLSLKTARGKLTESLVVILEDMLVFLQEKDQKFSLLSLDQKAPVIRLKNLFVREVATDTKAIFLVSTSKDGPEMYEIVCKTSTEKRTWIKNIREAILSAPKDDGTGELITTAAGERRKIILLRAEDLIERSKEAEDPGTRLPEMQELIAQLETEEATVKGRTREELVKSRESLTQVMNQVKESLSSIESGLDENTGSTGDPDQVGFKRAETFHAFDNKLKPTGADPAVIRAQSMKVERTGRSYDKQLPGVAASSSPEMGSPVTKHKRRGSGGSAKGWSIRSKSKDEKDASDMSKGDQTASPTSSSPVNTPDQEQKEKDDDECVPDQENCSDKPTPDVIYF